MERASEEVARCELYTCWDFISRLRVEQNRIGISVKFELADTGKISNGFEYWFAFIINPRVEPTNNRAVRALRS